MVAVAPLHRPTQTHYYLHILTFILGILILRNVILMTTSSSSSSSQSQDEKQTKSTEGMKVKGTLIPAHGNEEVEILWSSHKHSKQKPCGVLFVAHDCGNSHTDWFEKSSDCPECIGLPEERAIVETAYERNFAVIAASSYDRNQSVGNKTSMVLGLVRYCCGHRSSFQILPFMHLV